MKDPLLQKESYLLSRAQLPVLGIVLLIALVYVLHTMFSLTFVAWLLWGAVALAIMLTKLHKTSHVGLMAVGLALLLATPVGTSISWGRFFLMAGGMLLAVIVPYAISRYYFKHSLVHFNLNLRRKWSWLEIAYVVGAVVSCMLCMLLYFSTTNAHENWSMATPSDIAVVFTCIMVIGIWEEFFFIGTVYGILQRVLPYAWAIVLQAIFFSAFLFQIGFRGWIVLLVFLYAMFQAYVFHKTKTLLVTLVIHILVDFAVFVNLFLAARNML
ncbi:MAG TPA: type II CAAX endopeptidase family protein [Candidatus Saccharimonadales bacterium]|nr:type II CAAX endopeptidase family protein [Candidatus Saccharimonadales bacterium]